MFLLNVLLDLTDELDVFCQSFAIQITSASLYSILAYQIKYLLHPTPDIKFSIFQPPPPLLPPQE